MCNCYATICYSFVVKEQGIASELNDWPVGVYQIVARASYMGQWS